MPNISAREELVAASHWLAWQAEDLSTRLRSGADALRLWRYAQQHPELPDLADDWQPEHRREAIGYDPLRAGNA